MRQMGPTSRLVEREGGGRHGYRPGKPGGGRSVRCPSSASARRGAAGRLATPADTDCRVAEQVGHVPETAGQLGKGRREQVELVVAQRVVGDASNPHVVVDVHEGAPGGWETSRTAPARRRRPCAADGAARIRRPRWPRRGARPWAGRSRTRRRPGVGPGERREEVRRSRTSWVEPEPMLPGGIVDELAEVIGDPFPWTQSHGFIHGLVPPVRPNRHQRWRTAALPVESAPVAGAYRLACTLSANVGPG